MKILHLNATYYGGGVAEMLHPMVTSLNESGHEADWKVLRGTPEFYEVTKKFHNGLQGKPGELTKAELDLWTSINREYSKLTSFEGYDLIVIHDPQPLPLIAYAKIKCPVVWRCHIDLTDANPKYLEYVLPYINKYTACVFTSTQYVPKGVRIPVQIIHPAIPLNSDKNRRLLISEKEEQLSKCNLSKKPMLLQVSRMDPWKDPIGVIRVYKEVKKELDCQLVLCYNTASDDPEGAAVLYEAVKEAGNDEDIHFIIGDDPLMVNALQRRADIVLQKSLREGFGLVVTEAMVKEKLVIASNIGGIPKQIENGLSGILVDPYNEDSWVELIKFYLTNKDLCASMGYRAKYMVFRYFTISRLIDDYFKLYEEIKNVC